MLTNIGKQPVTHVVVDYGIKKETIQSINPGEKFHSHHQKEVT